MEVSLRKLLVLFMFFFGISFVLYAQEIPKELNDTQFSTYYQQRVSHFRTMPVKHGEIIFLGNSITDGAEWSELFSGTSVLNRGISGDRTLGILNRLDEVTQRKPSKLFLLIGTNDLAGNVPVQEVVDNTLLIAKIVKKESPGTKLYIQSILPVSDHYNLFPGHAKNGGKILSVNKALQENAERYHYSFIDIHSPFVDNEGKFKKEFTNDGLHLNGKAYEYWKHLIAPYVLDLQEKPALLPLPNKVVWQEGVFPLYALRSIVIENDSLQTLAKNLQNIIQSKGYYPAIKRYNIESDVFIELKIEDVADSKFSKEAYELKVQAEAVTISASTQHGLFNGIQTLRQLMRGTLIPAVEISDFPAFSWRGYMVDVGRNYQSMDLLKQQIDEMSKMKYNYFHFHLTEDVAWRLESKRYPQLTSPETMTRFHGMFYTEDDLKELIQYCKERFITFVPEIDMPGHSAAFERAMGFSMQSDSGLIAVKQILQDFCETYDLPYIHIGADEVKITNSAFLPEMIKTIEAYGKRVIGWEPGGNFTNSVIRQLWMDDLGKLPNIDSLELLDSRNLYINHMDAEESVVSIFNHAILDKQRGDHTYIGGILCLWNDRRLNTGDDNLFYNPVYPSMLAFAERSWRGGGEKGNFVSLNEENILKFTAFENRLIDIKKTFYKDLPFSYVRQSHLKWKLIGPYNNDGDLGRTFEPENAEFDFSNAENVKEVIGGTVILRHFWDPIIKGLLKTPDENTTYYAHTRYWSNSDTTALMWIGFYDFSRSNRSDPPTANTWSTMKSKIWLNGQEINPPQWQHAGQEGHLEIPYADENYYFRKPTPVQLKKGWNEVLIKVPVGGFSSGIWYSPIKWMFSAMIIEPEKDSINYKIGEGYRNLNDF